MGYAYCDNRPVVGGFIRSQRHARPAWHKSRRPSMCRLVGDVDGYGRRAPRCSHRQRAAVRLGGVAGVRLRLWRRRAVRRCLRVSADGSSTWRPLVSRYIVRTTGSVHGAYCYRWWRAGHGASGSGSCSGNRWWRSGGYAGTRKNGQGRRMGAAFRPARIMHHVSLRPCRRSPMALPDRFFANGDGPGSSASGCTSGAGEAHAGGAADSHWCRIARGRWRGIRHDIGAARAVVSGWSEFGPNRDFRRDPRLGGSERTSSEAPARRRRVHSCRREPLGLSCLSQGCA